MLADVEAVMDLLLEAPFVPGNRPLSLASFCATPCACVRVFVMHQGCVVHQQCVCSICGMRIHLCSATRLHLYDLQLKPQNTPPPCFTVHKYIIIYILKGLVMLTHHPHLFDAHSTLGPLHCKNNVQAKPVSAKNLRQQREGWRL